MSISELAGALLVHIREQYPEGSSFISTLQLTPPQKKERAAPVAKVAIRGIELQDQIPTPVILAHRGEGVELLDRLATALTQKRAPAQVLEVSRVSPVLLANPIVKLIVLTPEALEVLGNPKTGARLYTMERPQAYIQNPSLRKPLWEALCALL